jgi:hypothetical protein
MGGPFFGLHGAYMVNAIAVCTYKTGTLRTGQGLEDFFNFASSSDMEGLISRQFSISCIRE